jgi:RNA polymerase sigma-70 factor, ECF subfamily
MIQTSRQRGAEGINVSESEVGSGRLRRSEAEVALRRIYEQGHSAWPEIELESEPFLRHVMSLIGGAAATPVALEKLSVKDLFLAYACSNGNKAALAIFSREFAADLRAIGRKLGVNDSDLDDIRQKLWNKLFLGDGGQSKRILEYRGTGGLRNWYRVLAARVVLDEMRKNKRDENHQMALGNNALWIAVPDADPEIANIRNKYRDAFRAAFEGAARALEPGERNILRCHYLMGMSTEQLAEAFGFHKATAARHVVRARGKLLQLTRERVQSQLGANSGELDSVMRLFDGEISLSFSRLLS